MAYFGSQGPRFEFRWQQNLAHGCTMLHCIEFFIITLSLSQYDLNNVKRDINHQIIILFPEITAGEDDIIKYFYYYYYYE